MTFILAFLLGVVVGLLGAAALALAWLSGWRINPEHS